MSVEALIAAMSTGALICLVLGLRGMLASDTQRIDSRIRHYTGLADLTDDEQKRAASVQVTHLLATRIEKSVSGRTFAGRLRADLARGNVSVTVGEFLIVQASSATIVAGGAYVISRAPAVACLFAALGWFLPLIWLKRRQASRLKAFNNQLADTIDLMSNSLRSGLSLVQAMETISREAEPPIADEFQRVVREIGLGAGPQDALLHLAQRVASEDLELLVIAILVQFEVGGNLSRVLETIAGTIRERVKLHGEIRTLSAQGRMSGYILSGLPAGIGGLLMLIAPSYMGALFTPGPWLVLPVMACVGIVVGSLVIRALVAIEV